MLFNYVHYIIHQEEIKLFCFLIDKEQSLCCYQALASSVLLFTCFLCPVWVTFALIFFWRPIVTHSFTICFAVTRFISRTFTISVTLTSSISVTLSAIITISISVPVTSFIIASPPRIAFGFTGLFFSLRVLAFIFFYEKEINVKTTDKKWCRRKFRATELWGSMECWSIITQVWRFIGADISDRIGSITSKTFEWKSKTGDVSEIVSSTESESEGSEGFFFLLIPLLISKLAIQWKQGERIGDTAKEKKPITNLKFSRLS